jgi:hypothetical protein
MFAIYALVTIAHQNYCLVTVTTSLKSTCGLLDAFWWKW